MGIKSPLTFADFYWGKQVEAQELFASITEKELSTMASRLMGSLHIKEFLPPEFASLFSDIEAPAGVGLSDVGGRFVSEVADGAVSQAASPFFESMGYLAYKLSPTKKMTPVSTATLFSRKKISEEFFNERFRMGGFEPIEARFQYDSMRPYPSIPELVMYSRYHGDPDDVWSTIEKLFDIDPVDFKLWEWLGYQRLTTEQVHTLFRRKKIDAGRLLSEFAQIGWDAEDRIHQQELGWQIPNPMLLIQGGLIQDIQTPQLLSDVEIGNIHPDYAQRYLDAVLTKPATTDIVNYQLRKDPLLTDLEPELRKLGIHPNYFTLYQELAHIIPPVGDIITMAVREAFTPEIAVRFGQYEDFPDPFAEWAAKKGLSKEWAERYWASHWSLPSASQGFEMLHRKVIDEDELKMLLRALDIMPFWRDKLIQISYRPISRVDIRRMYAVGVLDEGGVQEAYEDLGYSVEKARLITEFVVRQAFQTLSKFTSRDVIAAYATRKVDKSEASRLLRDLGIRYEQVDTIIEMADYRKEWQFIDVQIKGIRNLYKKGVYNEEKTRSELRLIELPDEQINEYLKQWYYEEKIEEPKLWTSAQVLSFIKKKLITEDRGKRELKAIGYDDEHIKIYLASVKPS